MSPTFAIADALWASLTNSFFSFRIRLAAMVGDMGPLHYLLIVVAGVILWSIFSRRR